MTDKICHLCGTHYNDDPHMREQPAHALSVCLGILQFRLFEAEKVFLEVERRFVRAKLEYVSKK